MSALGRNPLVWAGVRGAVVLFGIVIALPSFAEDPEPAPATTRNVEEIVVTTARRRAEDLQIVPIPISAFSEGFLAKTGTWNILRLAELQPSLQIFTSNPRNTGLNIRGLGAPFGLTNDGIEPGVGLYVDDVFYARPAAAIFDFIDVEQVDVLRGPQGTLYGKNTTAGAINLRTRAPSFDPEARGELSFGRFGFVQAKTSLSGPLLEDKVAGRFSFATTQREGTVRNVLTNVDVNDQNNIGLKGQLLWRATDDINLTLYGDYNRQRIECCTQVIAGVAPTLRNPNRQFPAMIADLGYTPPTYNGLRDRVTDVDSDLQGNQDMGGTSLKLDWDIGGGTLTSVTAWRFWDWYPSNDRDFIGLPVTTISKNPSQTDQFTQEVRFASSVSLPELPLSIGREVDYVAGVFAYYQALDSQGAQAQGSAAYRFLLAPGEGVTPELLDGLTSSDDISLDTTSVAIFSQATWHLTERWSLTPGLRLNYDDKSGDFKRTVSGGLETDDPDLIRLKNSVLAPQEFEATFSDFNVSGQITTGYALPDSLTGFGDFFGYFTYARAFKSGGINIAGLPNRPDGTPALEVAEIDPETVDHLELGLKSTLFDGAVVANLALYQTEIQDYQAQVVNDQVGTLRGYLANADEVRVRGAELDIGARPHDQVDFYVNTAFTDGKYVDFKDAPCPLELTGGPPNCDVSGQKLPGIPDWATSFGAEFRVPASFSVYTGDVYVGVDGSFQSRFSSNPSPSEYLNVDDRTLFNFRGGYRMENGWEIFGWVRNAFEENYYQFMSPVGGNSGLYVGELGDPRTFGVTMRASF